MARRINDDYHIKIYLLYLYEKLATPLSQQTAAEIILWDGTVNYFVFMDCFESLRESGLLRQAGAGEHEEPLYELSPAGRELLESVENSLLDETKKKVLHSAARLLAYRRDGSRVKAVVRPEKDGYLLDCSIEDDRYPLLHLSVYLDHADEAEKFRALFDERSDIVYRGVLALLSGEMKFLM